MQRLVKWGPRLAGALVLLSLIAAGGGYLWLRGSLPQIDGRAHLSGLAAPVEVVRDGDGLVTIRAESEADAHRALGYVHAQDRLAQMDLMRRLGAGRLSEVLGDVTIEVDTLMRTLGLYDLAEASLAHLAPETLAAVEAYTAGVNAFLADPGGPLPLEFQLLGSRPEPWRPADSLVWGRLMAFQLSGNWSTEALRLRLSENLSRDEIDALWPAYPEDAPVVLDDRRAAAASPPPVLPDEVLPWAWAPKDASNAWVVSGDHTASGKPILANDIHLSLELPGQWYLARIETPDLVLAGATAPGVPFLVAGHNGRIAWAFTTTHSDTQDLYLERVSAGATDRYDTPTGPRAFETREETIRVRGEEDRQLTVRHTRHGPVVSDLSRSARAGLPEDQVLALAWPALRADDRTADAIYRINHAGSWDEFEAALADFHSPQQNLLYADRAGDIGFMAPARVPIRARGNGRYAARGWTGEEDWMGEIPIAELPRSLNPPGGHLVTANNKIVPDDYPYLITADWPNGYRAERLEALLAGAAQTTPDQHAGWQADTVSLAAKRLLPALLETVPQSARAQRALALLSDWDFRMARDRPQPLIYYAWLKAANAALLADELGEDFPAFQRVDVDLLRSLLTQNRIWCDDVTSVTAETCAEQLEKALETALEDLDQRFGGDMNAWRWGDAHVARFSSPLLGRIPVIGTLFTLEVETDGGEDTLNRGGTFLAGNGGEAFVHRHGATFRAVYDLADPDQSLFMVTGGQSGNPLSPYYGNLAEDWRDGIYLRLNGTPEEIAGRLLLQPE